MFKRPDKEPDFLQLVEAHERQWGTQQYEGRPSLSAIMGAPVVAVWRPVYLVEHASQVPEIKHVVTLHKELRGLEAYLARILIRAAGEMPNKRLEFLFEKHQRMTIAGVRILFKHADQQKG